MLGGDLIDGLTNLFRIVLGLVVVAIGIISAIFLWNIQKCSFVVSYPAVYGYEHVDTISKFLFREMVENYELYDSYLAYLINNYDFASYIMLRNLYLDCVIYKVTSGLPISIFLFISIYFMIASFISSFHQLRLMYTTNRFFILLNLFMVILFIPVWIIIFNTFMVLLDSMSDAITYSFILAFPYIIYLLMFSLLYALIGGPNISFLITVSILILDSATGLHSLSITGQGWVLALGVLILLELLTYVAIRWRRTMWL